MMKQSIYGNNVEVRVMSVVRWAHKRKCPKCCKLLLTDGDYVWCNYDECDFGIDKREV